jgi:hypothetical protein
MRFLTPFLLLLPLLFVFSGCRKSTNANWDVDAVLPVVTSELNIKNFIGDTIFKVDNTGLLHLNINREVASLKLDSLVKIPDTTIVALFKNPLPFGNVIQPGAPITPTISDIEFDFPDNVALKTAIIREGAIIVKFSNDLTQPLDILYRLPTVTKNNVAFVIKETIPAGQNSLEKTYDLSGYTFNLRGTSGNQFNTVAQTCSLNLSPSATTVFLQPNEGAKVEISYTKVIPDFVEGYFGQQTVDLPSDTAKINLIENFRASNFMLSEVTMDFTIINEFGVDFSGSISKNKSINTVNNNSVLLSNTQLSSININRAKRNGMTVYPSSKVYSFTNSNSNVAAFISNLPDKLTYEGNIQMNPVPPGNISGYNDFAFYNTGIRILAKIDIPMRFTADYFVLSTKSAIDFSKTKALDAVNSGRFVVSATNGFPFAAKVQGYMYDVNNNLIDSIFVPGTNRIAGGQVDAQNEVTAPAKSQIFIPISKQKIDNLTRCKTLKMVSYLLMPSNPPAIKILENYEIGIKIVAEVNYNVGIGN